MKKLVSLLLAMAMAASLAACGQKEAPSQEETPEGEAVELTVFAAASMTETLDEIITLYQSVAPQVTIVGVTDTDRTSPWNEKNVIVGRKGRWPEVDEVITAIDDVLKTKN